MSRPSVGDSPVGVVTAPQPGQSPGRILIAGTRSGAGKTTVTVALIAALRANGAELAAFKCGPDYIDGMFHRAGLGVPSYNLDPFFSSGADLRDCLARRTRRRLGVIEGVMGFYDGLGLTTRASTFEVAQATMTPVVLVLDATGMAASAGAVLRGFTSYRQPSGIQGVILNQTTASGYARLEPLIRQAGLTPLGWLPRQDAVAWPSRRLGLVAADEIAGLTGTVERLAGLAWDHLDLEAIRRLARRAPVLPQPDAAPAPPARPVRVGVARDEAFCFCYAETLDLLVGLGAEIVFFSPLRDPAPPATDALYLPGGYPEHHLDELAANQTMRRAVRERIGAGCPVIAECGGFMYLHDDIDGQPMAGVVTGSARRTDRLQRFGYATMTAAADSLLGPAGSTWPVHEFHYYDSTAAGSAFRLTKASDGTVHQAGHATATMYAGFPHLYLPAVPEAAARFLERARSYAARPAGPPPGPAGSEGVAG